MKTEFPIAGILKLLEEEDNFVFLETAKYDAENFLSYLFLRPEKVITTNKIDEIKRSFIQLDQALKQGYFVAGYLTYEAGEVFEERLRRKESYTFPLLWFGIYPEPIIYNHRQQNFEKASASINTFLEKIILKNECQKNYRLKNIRPNLSLNSYIRAIKKIKDLIAQGLTYQVNYTFKLKFSFSGSPFSLYLNLRNNQSVSYAAFIRTGENFILSFSPELFLRKNKNRIFVRPMKGTAGRGKDLNEDSKISSELKHSLKNRSENVMIVDLLRNDLGRISACGSIKVPQLFRIEKYETLFQMTSDVEGRLKDADLSFDIFSYIFPSGSVTGAPKIKTMQIIKELEKEPRNVYTGSIGFFAPKQSATFNVAIRTILLDMRKRSGEMGVGSGIIYDSLPKKEFAECCLKADFLTKQALDFQLIETILWRPYQGYFLLKWHLDRLKTSAQYFGFPYQREKVLFALKKLSNSFKKDIYRVRLLLFKNGEVKLEPSILETLSIADQRICLSPKKTQSQNFFLYHKTTNRRLYDEEYKRYKGAGFFDVIFSNEKDQITEGAISNVFIRKNGKFYTPPLSCGLLDGVYRRYLLASRKFPIQEKVLHKKDLFEAGEIYLSNSVRGLVKVRLEGKNH